MSDGSASLLQAVHEAVLAVTDELRLDVILGKIVDAARPLVGARYGALGVPDGSGGFEKFITSGMTPDEIEAIGPLPRQHGLLGALLEDSTPFRYPDISRHPRFYGFPRSHPLMKSFLGVPIVYKDEIIGSFYLTDKEDGSEFSVEDEQAISMLAAHAAIAIQNARLYEQSRELSSMEERNRLARELHDSVAQTLFNIVLESEVVASLIGEDSAPARSRIEQLSERARQAAGEIRALIFELRPPDLEREGLAETLRKHLDVVARVHHLEVRFAEAGDRAIPFGPSKELYRIAQEAINNVVKHAEAHTLSVRIDAGPGRVLMEIEDDGRGFEAESPSVKSHSLGLTSMEERAKALGGRLEVRSRPGSGSSVLVSLPLEVPRSGDVPR
jgi:signal transduction histidine kinase